MYSKSQSSLLGNACIYVLGAAIMFSWGAERCSAGEQSLRETLKKTILSLDKTRKTVFEHHFLAAAAGDPVASRDEALLFIAYLEGRISYYCETLYLSGGVQSLEGLPCGSAGQAGDGDPRFESVPDFSGQTSQEKVAALEEEFTTALGEFDDMLLEEQEKVAAHVPRQGEYGGVSQGEASTGAEGAAETGGDSEAREQSPGTRSDQSGSRQGGDGAEQGASSAGAGQGSTERQQRETTGKAEDMSEDDDVVARQLREAAEQETDPEVKEKLWEEYRKYKEGIR